MIGVTAYRFIINAIWFFNYDFYSFKYRNKIDFESGVFIHISFEIGSFLFAFFIFLLQTNKNVLIDHD